MTSVGAFNDMLGQFLSELAQTFPEEKAIKKYQASFDVVKKANPRKCVEGFMKGIGPVAQRVVARDETVIASEELKMLCDMNIAEHWSSCSDNTKNAIWQYLQTLYMLGTTITALPAETLNMIEDVAQKAAGSMQEGGGSFDEKALMGMFSNMLGGGGGSEK